MIESARERCETFWPTVIDEGVPLLLGMDSDWFYWPAGYAYVMLNPSRTAVLRLIPFNSPVLDDDLEDALIEVMLPIVAAGDVFFPVDLGWRLFRVPAFLASELSALDVEEYADPARDSVSV